MRNVIEPCREIPVYAQVDVAVRGAPERVILAEEEAAIRRSVAYCRDVLRLL